MIFYILKLKLAQKMKSKQIFIMDVNHQFRRREWMKTWKTTVHPEVTSLEAFCSPHGCVPVFPFMQTGGYKFYRRNPLESQWHMQGSRRHHSKCFRSWVEPCVEIRNTREISRRAAMKLPRMKILVCKIKDFQHSWTVQAWIGVVLVCQ